MALIPPPDGSRDPRIEDPTNLWVVHLAGRALLPIALRARIPANAVSLLGLLFGTGAAAAYYRWQDWRFTLAGLLLCILWLIADGLDGMIARASGTASAFGRFLDGVCDHLVFVLIYVSLASSLNTPAAWILAAVAGAAHALQATLYEGERNRFHRRVRGEAGAPTSRAGNLLVRIYDRVANSLDRYASVFDARMRDAKEPRRLGAAYGERAVPPLKCLALLSNNMRIVAITAACLAGDPRLFWWWELLPLMAVAIAGMSWHRRVEDGMMRYAG
jgi:hypothetical protein